MEESSKKYGITKEQYFKILESQSRRCAICKGSEPKGHGAWHIDHDHCTGVVRGLLCTSCNTGLGGFFDSSDLIQKAIGYLKKHGKQ